MKIEPCDDPNELLYLRLEDSKVIDKHVIPDAVALPDWSTNWSRFSKPEDVLDLQNRPLQIRIAQLRIGDIPQVIEPDPPAPGETAPEPWKFWAEHAPLVDNYSHAEVRTCPVDGTYVQKAWISSRKYKRKIREEFADKLEVYL